MGIRKREIVFKMYARSSRMHFVFKGDFAYDRPSGLSHSLLTMRARIHEDALPLGTKLCEPVLWVTAWQHRGNLAAISNGTLCEILPDKLEHVFMNHEAVLHDIVSYATKYVANLNSKATDAGTRAVEGLSDMCDDLAEDVFNDPDFAKIWKD